MDNIISPPSWNKTIVNADLPIQHNGAQCWKCPRLEVAYAPVSTVPSWTIVIAGPFATAWQCALMKQHDPINDWPNANQARD